MNTSDRKRKSSRYSIGSINSRAISTANSSTRGSMMEFSNDVILVSIVENRTKEIGIAAYNLKSPHLILTQFSDKYSYSHTITQLHLYQPVEILIPSSLGDSELSKAIKEHFPNSILSTPSRQYYSDTKGMELITFLNVVPNGIEKILSDKYLCLASAAALVKYIETIQSFSFSKNSLKISYKGIEGFMLIDHNSSANLELVRNKKSGKQNDTLFSCLNNCKTVTGRRLLRTNILQPPSDLSTIQLRLDALEELLVNEDTFFSLDAALASYIDIDHLIAIQFLGSEGLSTTNDQRICQISISNILCLKTSFDIVSLLIDAIEKMNDGNGPNNQLFKQFLINFKNEGIETIKEKIDMHIKEESKLKSNPIQTRNQLCFAVHENINGLLDVSRKTFSEIMEDISKLGNEYREEYLVSELKVKETMKRGFHFSLPKNYKVNPRDIEEFVQISEKGKFYKFSSEKLNSLNTRFKECVNEIFLLTGRVLEELIMEIKKYLSVIYLLSDTIAVLDMITSFANYVVSTQKCVRPKFDDKFYIKEGHHPILFSKEQKPVPNDTYLSEKENFAIISAPNMSGKSTYIRQVALLLIIASIGCYVPAISATFRITDKLFTRISSEDNIYSNSSSFMVEMKEMSYILHNCTSNSFVIVDELGRSTSTSCAVGISFACCEYLCSMKCFTLFTTHYSQITKLSTIYPNIKNCHMIVSFKQDDEGENRSVVVEESGNNGGGEKMLFSFKFAPGSCPLSRYGIFAAKKIEFPQSFLSTAQRVSDMVWANEQKSLNKRENVKAKNEIANRLLALKNTTLDEESVRRYLAQLRKRIVN